MTSNTGTCNSGHESIGSLVGRSSLHTVGRNFSCVAWSRPAFNPASHLLQQFSQRCDFEHINFEVRWRQGAVEQKGRIPDSGCGRAPKGSTAPLFAGRCRWWGRLERRYAILFLSTAARTGSRPGPQLGFCGWAGGLLPVLWEGKHSQVPVRSEACPCIISHNSIVPCSLVPAEHTPSEFVTTNINQFGPREVLTRGPDASEGRRTCRPQLEIDPRTSPVRHHRPLAGERITAAAQFRRGKGAPANSFSLRPPPREIEPAACARAPQQQQLSDWPRPLCLFVERYLIARWQVCSALLL